MPLMESAIMMGTFLGGEGNFACQVFADSKREGTLQDLHG